MEDIIVEKYNKYYKDEIENKCDFLNAIDLSQSTLNKQKNGQLPVDRSLLLLPFLFFVFLEKNNYKEQLSKDIDYIALCNRLLEFTYFEILYKEFPLDKFIIELLSNNSIENAFDILFHQNSNIFKDVARCISTNRDSKNTKSITHFEKK